MPGIPYYARRRHKLDLTLARALMLLHQNHEAMVRHYLTLLWYS